MEEKVITLEDMQDYLDCLSVASSHAVQGVLMLFLSMVPCISLMGLYMEYVIKGMNAKTIAIIGGIIWAIMLVLGILKIVKLNKEIKPYAFIENKEYRLSDDAKEFILEEKNMMLRTYRKRYVIGVVICIVGIVPFLLGRTMNLGLSKVLFLFCLMLVIQGVGFSMIFESAIQQSAFYITNDVKE